jgi:hypothetical protein
MIPSNSSKTSADADMARMLQQLISEQLSSIPRELTGGLEANQ